MTVSLKHAFASAKADGLDNTLVQPSNWNAEHALTLATGKVLGRQTAGSGAVEELACSALAASILAATDAQSILTLLGIGAATTGDVKLTIKIIADTGWIMCNDGTIGSATSGATYAATDAQALFLVLWAIPDTYAPVTGGRGANAAADWAANKKIALTKVLGRSLAISGSGSGLTARSLGQTLGEETHTLIEPELPALTKSLSLTDPGHHHSFPPGAGFTDNFVGSGGPTSAWTNSGAGSNTANATTGITGTVSFGGGTAHNVMQPTSFLNAMIKL